MQLHKYYKHFLTTCTIAPMSPMLLMADQLTIKPTQPSAYCTSLKNPCLHQCLCFYELCSGSVLATTNTENCNHVISVFAIKPSSTQQHTLKHHGEKCTHQIQPHTLDEQAGTRAAASSRDGIGDTHKPILDFQRVE